MDERRQELLVPLFPLNVVLYPGMLMPLHIFEPRYRAMINDTMQGSQSFVVVLIADGMPEGDVDVVPKSIGTVAQIAQLRHLNPEQMSVWVVGAEKIEILDYHRTADDYLMARVRVLNDTPVAEGGHVPPLETLHKLFAVYIDLKLQLNDHSPDSMDYELAVEPDELSYQIAGLLDVSLAEKQALLEMSHTSDRLAHEATILEREIRHLQELLKSHVTPRTQPLPWGGEVNLN